MAEVQLNEASTFDAQSWAANFFSVCPTDRRF